MVVAAGVKECIGVMDSKSGEDQSINQSINQSIDQPSNQST